VPILGFTATFGRADGLALGKVFEMIAWHSDWIEMIKGNWLSQLQFTTVRLGDALDLSKVDLAASGEFNQNSLAAVVDRPQVTDLAVQAWLSKASTRRSTIVFAINIAHIHSIVDHFREAGIDARFVHEKVRPREREATLQAFRNGEFPVLVNCGILTEGADFPAVDCVLMARPTRSANLFIQMLGRGLRLSPDTGKTNCLVLDLVGSSVQGLACTPTLFGIDPDQAIEDQSTDQLEQLAEERPAVPAPSEEDLQPEQSATEFEVEYTDVDIFDLVKSRDEKPHLSLNALTSKNIRTLSPNAWIGMGGGTFVLELMGNYISLNPIDGKLWLTVEHNFEADGCVCWQAECSRLTFTSAKAAITNTQLGASKSEPLRF
jgi:ATP-dependent helicase IRC3